MVKQASYLDEHILNALQFHYLPEDKRVELMDSMVETVNQRLLLRIFQALDKKNQAEYQKLAEKGTTKEMQSFVEKHVPNFLDLVVEEVEKLKKEVLVYGAK